MHTDDTDSVQEAEGEDEEGAEFENAENLTALMPSGSQTPKIKKLSLASTGRLARVEELLKTHSRNSKIVIVFLTALLLVLLLSEVLYNMHDNASW